MQAILVSRRDAALLLGLSLRSIDYLLVRGQLAAKKVGRRTLITRASLERFCRSDRTVGITTPSPAEAERQ
jgi:excisionase family DNA binding protein